MAVLMHKNVEVARIGYKNGKITEVYEVLNARHMPVGTYEPKMSHGICCTYMQAWLQSRSIPSDRENIHMLLKNSGKNILELNALSHGMGLTDQYWIRNDDESITWEEVDFRRNGFEYSPFMLSGEGKTVSSPDYATNGILPKTWMLIDNVPFLLKDSPTWLPTASANEVVAYEVAQRCGICHAAYYPFELNGKILCASPCFVDGDDEDFVSFQTYRRTHRGPKLDIARSAGLDEKFLNEMTAFDFLLGNTDRHEGNFGMILEPESMIYLYSAPLFDSGTCLHDGVSKTSNFKPFYKTKKEAFDSLVAVNINIPSDTVLYKIVSSVYEDFKVSHYTGKATEEICKNAEELRKLII